MEKYIEQIFKFFHDDVRLVLKAPKTPLETSIYGYILKIYTKLETAKKLNSPHFIYEIGTLQRSMFEIIIDLGLLSNDPNNNEKLLAWERYSKFKHNRSCANNHTSIDLSQIWNDYVTKHQIENDNDKTNFWPNISYINRWTGNNLKDDARELDNKILNDVEINELLSLLGEKSFYEYYIRYNDYLCWYTHGSGFITSREIDAQGIELQYNAFLGHIIVFAIIGARFALLCSNKLNSLEQKKLKKLKRAIKELRYYELNKS